MNSPGSMEVREFQLSDLKLGMFASYDTIMGEVQVAEFAALTGDASPLHVDPGYGATTSYGGNVVHGMLTASHFSTVVGMLLPGRNALLSNMETSFLDVIPVGATVTITGRISAVRRAVSMVEVTFSALHGGKVCVRSRALVRIRNAS